MSVVRTDPQVNPETVKRAGIYDVRHRTQPWYEAYMRALFEPNSQQVLERLRSAERLMIEREREIHNQAAAVAERNALDRALEALRALRLCLSSGTKSINP